MKVKINWLKIGVSTVAGFIAGLGVADYSSIVRFLGSIFGF